VVKSFACRGKQYYWHRIGPLRLNALYALCERLGHHDHAWTTSKWSIINPPVISGRKIAWVGKFDIDKIGFERTARYTGCQKWDE
jgi:hypothetical protein